jgi:hypothetical protein
MNLVKVEKLTHLSETDAGFISKVYDITKASGYMKPNGFWYGVDDDWQRWCESENYKVDEYKYIYEVDLGSCNILKITNRKELLKFHNKYSIHIDNFLMKPTYHDRSSIDWSKVSEEYDGVQIAPYIWSERLNLMWYYGWDCASGVVWRMKDMKVTLIGPIELKQREWSY